MGYRRRVAFFRERDTDKAITKAKNAGWEVVADATPEEGYAAVLENNGRRAQLQVQSGGHVLEVLPDKES